MLKEDEMMLLGYNDFLSAMKEAVMDIMGEEFTVNINHVIKNNSIELDGLTIFNEELKLTPNIYLNAYYEKYLEGEEIEDLANEVVGIYEDSMEEGEREVFCMPFELDEMKPFIIFRLINKDKNSKLLQQVPYVPYLDLAITFHCLVKDNEEGIGTIRITNEHLEKWNINIEELKQFALINTPKLFPSKVRNMNEVIKDIFKKEMLEMSSPIWKEDSDKEMDSDENREDTAEQSAEEMLESMFDGMDKHKSEEMYVLTNTKGINGASCLLYPEVLKQVAEMLNANFYILPSSIHEVILVVDNGSMNKSSLNEMVYEVNRTQVAEDEVLSDQVYYYDKDKQAIRM